MDLTPWIQLASAAVGSGITLFGIRINGGFEMKKDTQRLEAENTREQIRLEREDAERSRAEAAAERADAKATGERISAIFLDELKKVRQIAGEAVTVDDVDFFTKFLTAWKVGGDLELRRAIAEVRDDDTRDRLLRLVGAIGDVKDIATVNPVFSDVWIGDTFELGFNIASSLARGQELDDKTAADLERLDRQMSKSSDYKAQRYARLKKVQEERLASTRPVGGSAAGE